MPSPPLCPTRAPLIPEEQLGSAVGRHGQTTGLQGIEATQQTLHEFQEDLLLLDLTCWGGLRGGLR